jgi:hypothetical protein
MIEAQLPAPRGQVVLHWFTGSEAEARRPQRSVNQKRQAPALEL